MNSEINYIEYSRAQQSTDHLRVGGGVVWPSDVRIGSSGIAATAHVQ